MGPIETVSSSMEKLSLTQNSLPEDLMFSEILPRLPTKSIVRFKSVSKTWLSRISGDSSFISGHIDRQNSVAGKQEPGNIIRALYKTEKKIILRMFFLGHNESKLAEIDTSYVWSKPGKEGLTCVVLPIGSGDGLVCLKLLYSDETHSLALWNPATREVRYLPEASVAPGCEEKMAKYSLGFDEQSGDHKLLRFEEVKTKDDGVGIELGVQIFTRTSGHWRDLNRFLGIWLSCGGGQGLTAGGTMHWAVETPAHPCPFHVLSFDIRNERFRDLDGPLCLLDEDRREDFEDLHLVKWRGSLGAILVRPDRVGCEFWSKVRDGEVKFHWEKVSSIDPTLGPVKSSGFFRDRLLLSCDNDGDVEFLYDLVTKEKRELEGDLGKVHFYNIFDHLHTLVSPN